MAVRVFDRYGTEQSWAWLVAHYGELQIHSAFQGPGWRIVELRENADLALSRVSKQWIKAFAAQLETVGHKLEQGLVSARDGTDSRVEGILAPAVIIAKFLQADGSPAVGQPVTWYWPDAPQKPGCIPLNGLEPGIIAGRYDGPGVTNGSGLIGFAMGGGAYYTPPDIGPHALWPCCPGLNGESIRGLGMLAGTNHYSIWPTYQWIEEPEPGECPREEIEAELAKVEAAVTAIQDVQLLAIDEAIAAIRGLLG